MQTEMIYQYEMSKPIVLVSTEHKGFNFKVVSYGTHPCCYVQIPETNELYKQHYDNDKCSHIDCHGGLTFSDFINFGDGENWYIGWDYAHINDYNGIYDHPLFKTGKEFQGKKWTTLELIKDCMEVIDQLCQMK